MLQFEYKTLEEVSSILDNAQVCNSRYSKVQFEKYLGLYDLKWLVAYLNKIPVAMCVIQQNLPKSYVYVNEIQAFISGYSYGRQLLEYVLEQHSNVWLLKDISQKDSLLHYYRSLRLSEFKYLDKQLHKWQHVFYQNCDIDVLKKYLKS